jgi:endonuclease/exonuclease/phosphatase family metal-dependent hydrolase
VKGLPPIATPGYGTARFDEISRQLSERVQKKSAPDVVLLQEAFTDESKNIVIKSGYTHWAQGPSRQGSDAEGEFQKSFSSGLFILSRHPIIESGLINFDRSHCATWDCYANKGIQYVKIQIPGFAAPAIFFNTHMQAGKKHEEVRKKQLLTLLQFFQSQKSENALLFFGGDFNTRPDMETYQTLANGLQMRQAGLECLSQPSSCSVAPETPATELYQDTVDHIFFAGAPFMKVTFAARNFREKFEDQFLSDHFGYEVEFKLQQQNNSR